MEALTNLTEVIISQYICVSNHHAVYLNLHNVIYQLYLHKVRERRRKEGRKETKEAGLGKGRS